MHVTATRTLASDRIGRVPGSRGPRSLLATLREWTAAGVLVVAIPLAGCLSPAEALDVDGEIRSLSQEIATLEASDDDGTPLTAEERTTLQQLYAQRDSLRAYRRTFGHDTGPGQGAGWITRLLGGDPTAIGAGVGALVSGLYGRRVYKKRKAAREHEQEQEHEDAPVVTPLASTGESSTAHTLAEVLRDARERLEDRRPQ